MCMPRTPHRIIGLMALCLCLSGTLAAPPEGPHLGKPLTPADLEGFDIHVFPDGTGLPEGSGNTETGAKLYEALCASCHGPQGIGAALVSWSAGHHSTARIRTNPSETTGPMPQRCLISFEGQCRLTRQEAFQAIRFMP